MNCRDAEHEMQCALDAPLTPPQRARLDAHLNVCPACRSAWDDHRRLSRAATEWVRQPAAEETAPALFTAQVLARLEICPAPVPVWPRLLTAGGCAILLAALSVWVSPWLPPVPHWEMPWLAMPDLGAAQGALSAHWATLLLLPALALNALFILRARRPA